MGTVDRKELMKEFYDALLHTAGAVVISMASRRILKKTLGTPETVKGAVKLAAVVGLETIGEVSTEQGNPPCRSV